MAATLSLASYVNLYIFTVGRRLFALRKVLATPSLREALVTHIETAITHDKETRAMLHRWAQQKAGPVRKSEARSIDHKIDATLGAIQDVLEGPHKSLPPEHPERQAAETLLAELFPRGVGVHITQSHVDQLSANDLVLGVLKKHEHAAAIEARGLSAYVTRLGELNDSFRKELERDKAPELTFDTVEAHDALGQENLVRVFIKILAEDDDATRSELAAPILEQNEAIGEHMRRRRTVPDVDPDTGEELPAGVPEHAHTVISDP